MVTSVVIAALLGSACGDANTKAEERVAFRALAIDVSLSTNLRLADIRDDARGAIVESVTEAGGIGSVLEVTVFGGGPGDTRTNRFADLCTSSARSCRDPLAVNERVARRVAGLDGLIASGATVGGSDPLGFLFRALAALQGRIGRRHPIHLIVWTDLASRSDTLDIEAGIDLSTPSARRAVIGGLAVRGLDFSALHLDAQTTVEIRLVPTDISSASTVYGEQLTRFVSELIVPTGARLTVSWMTHDHTNH